MANSHQLQKAALILAPDKARVLPSVGKRQFAVYSSAELSRRCLSSQTQQPVCAHALPSRT